MGQRVNDRYEQAYYDDADVFVVCFAMDRRDSLISCFDYWVNTLRRYKNRHGLIVPRVLVGLRKDISSISEEQVKNCQIEGGYISYILCSAKEEDNVTDVFYEATVAGLDACER